MISPGAKLHSLTCWVAVILEMIVSLEMQYLRILWERTASTGLTLNSAATRAIALVTSLLLFPMRIARWAASMAAWTAMAMSFWAPVALLDSEAPTTQVKAALEAHPPM